MSKKAVSVIMLSMLLISMLILAFNIQLVKTEPATIIVPDDYPTIQEAINAANSGDTILVSAGTYHEYVYVNKSLSIIGEGADTTTVWSGDVFEVHADNVTISGFTIDCDYVGSSVALYDSYGCNISHNIMHDGFNTIFLYRSSNNFIAYNDVFPAWNGWGIYLYYPSDNNIIRGNKVVGAREGIGIFVVGCDNNKVEYNKVRGNYNGIAIDHGKNNVINGNTVENNRDGIALGGGFGNRVYHNNLINNPYEVMDTGKNTWDNGYPSGGNYWSDYNGTDISSGPKQNRPGSDGLGDMPYIIDEDSQGNYPLMKPHDQILHDVAILNVEPSVTEVYIGAIVNITVTVRNFGDIAETFNLTAYYNNAKIGMKTIPYLTLEENVTFTFSWNTKDVAPGNYTTRAEATTVPKETNTDNNIFIDGSVKIKILGDTNGDGVVNIYDIVLAAAIYGSTPEDPNWNPDADLARPWGIINIYDLVTVASHYGEEW